MVAKPLARRGKGDEIIDRAPMLDDARYDAAWARSISTSFTKRCAMRS